MSSETKQILTTDGIPLEVSLKKAEKKNKIKAFLLVAPLLLFIIILLATFKEGMTLLSGIISFVSLIIFLFIGIKLYQKYRK